MTNLDSILKKQRHDFVNKYPSSQGYGVSGGYVWMWELDYKVLGASVRHSAHGKGHEEGGST